MRASKTIKKSDSNWRSKPVGSGSLGRYVTLLTQSYGLRSRYPESIFRWGLVKRTNSVVLRIYLFNKDRSLKNMQ